MVHIAEKSGNCLTVAIVTIIVLVLIIILLTGGYQSNCIFFKSCDSHFEK